MLVLDLLSSWWFQPIWKIWYSQIGSFPQRLGWKFQKYFKPPPGSDLISTWHKSSQTKTTDIMSSCRHVISWEGIFTGPWFNGLSTKIPLLGFGPVWCSERNSGGETWWWIPWDRILKITFWLENFHTLALSNQVRTNGNYRCNCWPSQSFFMIFSSDRVRKKIIYDSLGALVFFWKNGWRSVASIWFLPLGRPRKLVKAW